MRYERAIQNQIARLDWSRPLEEIAATLVEAGFRLRDLSDARFVDKWSGSPDPADPDHVWIDDDTGERVNALTGERASLT